MYLWRKLTPKQREDAIRYRRVQRYPKHSLPHFDRDGEAMYLVTAACYEHKHVLGRSTERMTECESQLLEIVAAFCTAIYAWCLLPNHYHLLLRTARMTELRKEIGQFHGRTSFRWNGEDDSRGRTVWRNCFEREIHSGRHFFATLNYVLNNAVHHGYVSKWQDWPWSNAREYLESIGEEQASTIWKEYPVLDYGKKWDVY